MGNLSVIEIITRISTVVIIYFLLTIPDNESFETIEVDSEAFSWNQEKYWTSLENEFIKFKTMPCTTLSVEVETELVSLR